MGCAGESVRAVDDIILKALHVLLDRRVDALLRHLVWQWGKERWLQQAVDLRRLSKGSQGGKPGADRRVQTSMWKAKVA